MQKLRKIAMGYITEITDLIIYIIKGVIIGIVASAPMGPVGVLCIRRTIKKGRIYGLMTGAGAAMSDLIYAIITGYGISLLPFLQNPQNEFWMKLVGSALLCGFGIHMYRTKPAPKLQPESAKKGSLFKNFFTAFMITLCNPMIVFLFIALFNMFAPFVGTGENFVYTAAGFATIVGGAMLWWLGLTYVINKTRNTFGEKGIIRMNRTIGGVVLTLAFFYAMFTLLNISITGFLFGV